MNRRPDSDMQDVMINVLCHKLLESTTPNTPAVAGSSSRYRWNNHTWFMLQKLFF